MGRMGVLALELAQCSSSLSGDRAQTVQAEVCPCRSWGAFALGAVEECQAVLGVVWESPVLGWEGC